MKKQQYITAVALWFISAVLMAQNETDAFRYAQYSPTGTARYTSLGGSMGGFGADFTVLSASNPAGIGLYKRSEIAFTPVVQYTAITSHYNETSLKYGRPYFNLNNLGFVLSVPVSSKWKYIQFATGYNNLARYDGYSVVKGDNHSDKTGSTNFFDHIAEWANGIPSNKIYIQSSNQNYNQFPFQWRIASLLWDNYILDTVPGTNNQYLTNVYDKFEQKQTMSTKGYLNEYVFSMGGNYNDMLYVGATIGIPFFKYTQETIYTESTNVNFDNLEYYNEFQSKATGVNFKFGLLYQPVKFMRFGAGFHTPTLFPGVKETYDGSFNVLNYYNPHDSNYYNLTVKNGGDFEYLLITPYHVTGNIAFLFDRYGFLNIDYEYVNYATSHMQSLNYDFAGENENTKTYYQGTHTLRAGAEINLTPVAFRFGYSYASNPYKNLDKDGTTQIFSAGIGYKSRYFFVDFGYRYRMFKDKDMFYAASNLHPYTTELVNQQFALTFGWKISR
jgi:hypothetical protein